jgi:nucleoside-diphosphate-sugar epimerase
MGPDRDDSHTGRAVTLVLGARGWIGRAVLRAARESGPALGSTRSMDNPGFSTVTGPHDLEQLLSDRDVGVVVNCAGTTAGDDATLTAVNVHYARMVAEVCRRNGVRLVHVGSAAEYGGAGGAAVRETDPAEPVSPYGRSKLAGTRALLQLAEQGLDVTVARLFNVIGAGQPLSTPIGEFAEAIRGLPASGGDVVVGDSTLVRDFISRTFVADALLRLGRATTQAQVVNVCSGRGLRFADLILAMADVRGVAVRILDTRPGGIPQVIGDPSLLHALIGPVSREGMMRLAREALQPSD